MRSVIFVGGGAVTLNLPIQWTGGVNTGTRRNTTGTRRLIDFGVAKLILAGPLYRVCFLKAPFIHVCAIQSSWN
jgi:hypothetical protein